MKISISFTDKEKAAINSFVERIDPDITDVFNEDIGKTVDQVDVKRFERGFVISTDEDIVTKLIRFVEGKFEAAKMVFNFFKGTINEYKALIRKNITHKSIMTDLCETVMKEDNHARYVICAYRSEDDSLVPFTVRYAELVNMDELNNVLKNADEVVICDMLGINSDVKDEIIDFVMRHNDEIKMVNKHLDHNVWTGK